MNIYEYKNTHTGVNFDPNDLKFWLKILEILLILQYLHILYYKKKTFLNVESI